MNDLDWVKSVVNNLDASRVSSDTLDSLIKVLAKKRGEVVDRENILLNEKKVEEEKINSFISMDLPEDYKNSFDNVAVPNCSSCGDGLLYSIMNLGRVDIEYISKCTGKSVKTVIRELEDSIFLDPEKWDGDEKFYTGWVTKDEYLSGNLIKKHRIANTFNKKYRGFFQNNLRAIESVLPERLTYKDIYVTLGSPWLPTDIIEDFMVSFFRTSRRKVKHDTYTGSWQIEPKWGYGVRVSVTYGTDKINAFYIMERTLNLQPITVYKDVFVPGVGTKRVADDKATSLALEKQRILIDEFQHWVWNDEFRRKRLENIYYEQYGCYRKRYYDGSFLSLNGLADGVKLYDYQKNAVARILLSKNVLLAHDVGSGKTFEMIAAGQELRRIGKAKKVMYVVPNNIVSQWEKIYKLMYPNANILIVTNKNFKPMFRLETLSSMRDNDYDGIIIDYSSFGMIKLSKGYYVREQEDTIKKLEAINYDRSKDTTTVSRKLGLLRANQYSNIDKLNEEYEGIEEQIFFEDLKIDYLFVDEAHNFKNVPFDTKTKNILGINPTGSEKCKQMMDKVHYVQSKHKGGGVVFATGTPVTNSISDAFIIQKYLQESELEELGISNFDGWANMFGELKPGFEIDVTANTFRIATRLSRFHNIPELSTIMSNVVDFYHLEKDESLPNFEGYEDVTVEKGKPLARFLDDISERAEKIREGMPDKVITVDGNEAKDNMLLVTTDGRKAALDMRLIDIFENDYTKESKVQKCSEKIYELYRRYNDIKATQLVFCDISVPKDIFNIYDELKRILTKLGIPENEIAYIHDANSDSERLKLFRKVNNGDIRVLIGSTFKLGTGVNVQNKLIAIHHIDVPWRPSDMVQREGRILRPGNSNKEIYIYRYITKNSFDAYSWQLLETKQNFISKLLDDKAYQRDVDDIDNTVLNYAEVKALAVGNPLIKERVETYNEIQRLRGLRSQFKEQSIKLRETILHKKNQIESLKDELENAFRDKEYFDDVSKNIEITPKERKTLGETILKDVLQCNIDRKEIDSVDYLGFKVTAVPSFDDNKQVIYVSRKGRYQIEIGNSDTGVMIRIDNFLKNLDDYIINLKKKINQNREYISSGQHELFKEEPYSMQIEELEKQLASIDRKLMVT